MSFKGVYIGCIVYADDTLLIYVKKLTSLKLNVRTMWWYHSTKTAKIFFG